MDRPIVVVGSINLDLVCTAKKIPLPGETVWGDRFQQFHGGKGANQAVAAGRLGGNVSMVAKVGDDAFGANLCQSLRDANVGVHDVGIAEGTASGVALISVDEAGQNSIIVVPGANAALTPGDLEKCLPSLRAAGIILAQLEIPMDAIEYLCCTAKRFQVPLMLDPAPARQLPASLLEGVTYLTPNETETCTLCGIAPEDLTSDALFEVARSLRAMGPANVLIKMGRQGIYLSAADGTEVIVPAFEVSAVDTTAAGDAFNGGCAVGLIRGGSLLEAVQYGIGVAAVSVTRSGAQPAMPSAEDVVNLFEKHGRKLPELVGRSVRTA